MTPAMATDRLETLLGRILRWGAISSTALLAAGLLLQLTGGATGPADWLTRAGLIVLMATPVARVAASVVGFLVERDWTFLALTATVLAILLGSLLIGIGG